MTDPRPWIACGAFALVLAACHPFENVDDYQVDTSTTQTGGDADISPDLAETDVPGTCPVGYREPACLFCAQGYRQAFDDDGNLVCVSIRCNSSDECSFDQSCVNGNCICPDGFALDVQIGRCTSACGEDGCAAGLLCDTRPDTPACVDPCADSQCESPASCDPFSGNCTCPDGSAPPCAVCPDGYEQVPDGRCLATCETLRAGDGCEACAYDLSTGIPSCTTCKDGYTPDLGACACPPGQYREGDSDCEPGCPAMSDGFCDGPNEHCDDVDSADPTCVCDVGYAGEGCVECATGFARDPNGSPTSPCFPLEIPPGTRFLSLGVADNAVHLYAIRDTVSPFATPLATVRGLPPYGVYKLAYLGESKLAISGFSGFTVVDLGTGDTLASSTGYQTVSDVLALGVGDGGSLLVADALAVDVFDPTLTLVDTFPHAALDPVAIGLEGAELMFVDAPYDDEFYPTASLSMAEGDLPSPPGLSATARVGIAPADAGGFWVLDEADYTEERLRAVCRLLAKRASGRDFPAGGQLWNAGDTGLVVADQPRGGVSIAFADGDFANAPLRVDLSVLEEDEFVCVLADGYELTLEPGNAGGVLVLGPWSIALELATDHGRALPYVFVPPAELGVYLQPSAAVRPDVVRQFGLYEWVDRRLLGLEVTSLESFPDDVRESALYNPFGDGKTTFIPDVSLMGLTPFTP